MFPVCCRQVLRRLETPLPQGIPTEQVSQLRCSRGSFAGLGRVHCTCSILKACSSHDNLGLLPGLPGLLTMPPPSCLQPSWLLADAQVCVTCSLIQEYLRWYCEAAGVSPPSPSAWSFYLALSLFRLLAILAGVQARARQVSEAAALGWVKP
jgi:hypothetical protein